MRDILQHVPQDVAAQITNSTEIQADQTVPVNVQRQLERVASLVQPGSMVTLEGTPLYAGEPWTTVHEFGLNIALPTLGKLLEERNCEVRHVVMIDDFTTSQFVEAEVFTEQMRVSPHVVVYESQFAQRATEVVADLSLQGKTITEGVSVKLGDERGTRLWTQSDRPSCETLDACFQATKHGDAHVIIHPNEFIKQQAGMRDILTEITEGNLPGTFINVFHKSGDISRIMVTDQYGNTERIK